MVKAIKKIPKKLAGGGETGTGKLKLSDIPAIVKVFMPEFQQKIIVGSEEHWDTLADLKRILETMPHTYQTEKTKTNDKIVWLHYFYGESDWYIVEKDKIANEQTQAFGYVILNGDLQNSEWGYISIEEIKDTHKIELDFYFTPIKFGELKKQWDDDEPEPVKPQPKKGGSMNFLYGEDFGVPARYSIELISILKQKGFTLESESPGILYFVKGIHKFYVNDNGGEFNLGDTDSNEHISNVAYKGREKNASGSFQDTVREPEAIAKEIEADVNDFYDFPEDLKPMADNPMGSQDFVYVGGDLVRFNTKENCNTWIKKIGAAQFYEAWYNPVETDRMPSGWYMRDIQNPDHKMAKEEFLHRFEFHSEDEAEEDITETEPEIPEDGTRPEDHKRDREQEIKDEYEKKRQSLDEFFTPKWVAEIMWKLAIKHGYSGGNITEPSFGHGVFFDVATENGLKQEQLYGFEIFPANVAFVKARYPKANLVGHNFEYEFAKNDKALNRDGIFKSKNFQDAEIDMFIGNPPYGNHKSPYSYLWDDELQVRIEGFFIWLALSKVKKGGLVVMIVNSLWLYNGIMYNKQKQRIYQLGDLIDAYRLPSGTFKGENRDTSIATDIVVFRRK